MDALLDSWRDKLGQDIDAYRGHLYRMANFTRYLTPDKESALEPIAVAGFFHDLDFILNRNPHYLEPSAKAAEAYLRENRRDALIPLVTDMIVWHHKLTPYKGEHGELVEHFRQADLVDLSLGVIRCGIDRAFIREAKRAFPNAGFHKRLAAVLIPHALTHPFKPLPMLRP